MAENSKIEWTDHTFNPWQGCTKVSPGCTNCYAEARDKRWHGGEHWGVGAPRLLKKDWGDPVRWNAKHQWACDKCGCTVNDPESLGIPFACPECQYVLSPKRPRVFCASLADWLDDEVPIEWLARLLALIHATPNLDWLLLTKRPQNFEGRVLDCRNHFCGQGKEPNTNVCAWLDGWRHFNEPPQNVWVGTTVEDQKRADERIPALLQIPARVRFLSVEPMLEAVDLLRSYPFLSGNKIHWAIFGGESGHGARPLNIEWIRAGVKQCRSAGIAPFVKQLGAKPYGANIEGVDDYPLTLNDKKGGDWSEWPTDLRVREFPNHLQGYLASQGKAGVR